MASPKEWHTTLSDWLDFVISGSNFEFLVNQISAKVDRRFGRSTRCTGRSSALLPGKE